MPAAELTIAVSEDDRRRLARDRARRARRRPIPTGVDTAYFTPARHAEVPARLVFTRLDGLASERGRRLYFVDTILPRDPRRDSRTSSLAMVGRNPTERLRALRRAQPASPSPARSTTCGRHGRGSVYVVPLRAGGGTRLKIFEALAMGKAVVSTTVGAEGLAADARAATSSRPTTRRLRERRRLAAARSAPPPRARAGRAPPGRRALLVGAGRARIRSDTVRVASPFAGNRIR